MTPQEFKRLCKKYNVKLKDLPAFPGKFTDDQWIHTIKVIGESREGR